VSGHLEVEERICEVVKVPRSIKRRMKRAVEYIPAMSIGQKLALQ